MQNVKTMQAVQVQAFGDASGMTAVETAEPVMRADQLLIQVEAIGVGGVDAVIRRGTLGGAGLSAGFVPGSEVAGQVIAVGAEVESSWIGQRVWAFTGISGGYAQRAVAAVDDVTVLPANLSSIDAVALGSATPVAHFALAHARFAEGQSVLIRGAAGSIGIMAVQLAAAGGASAVGVTTSSAERGDRLRLLGATHVLDRSGNEFDDSSRRGTESPNGDATRLDHDIVLDVVAGAAMPSFFQRLTPNGRMVLVGVVGGYPPADFGLALMGAFQKSLSFGTFSLDTVPVTERNRARADQFQAAAGRSIHAVVHDVLPLAEAAEAHRRMDAGEVFGRIVLTT